MLLLGRVTYEEFVASWPLRSGDPFADRMNSLPKFVASTTLQEPLEWNATLLEGDVAEAVANVKEHRGGRPHRHCGLLPADQCVSERRARVDDAASGTN